MIVTAVAVIMPPVSVIVTVIAPRVTARVQGRPVIAIALRVTVVPTAATT